MQTNTKAFLTALTLLFGGVGTVSAANPSILSICDSLHSVPVVPPSSFETDAHAMMENWYLTHYVKLDRDADSRAAVNVTDDEIVERLKRLPNTIEMPYNSVVRTFIDMYARKRQLVENMLGMSTYYMPIFEEALDRYGLPLELKYLPIVESALNPDAVSRAGAAGLWQFMIPTAGDVGLEVNSLVDMRRDPYASSDAAARYLGRLYGIYKDWSLAIAAYNCGAGNVNKALARVPKDAKNDFWTIYPFLPKETRGYVPTFIAANYIMNYYDKHNIAPAAALKPIVTDTVHVDRRIHLQQISDVLDIPMNELRILNPQYRQDIIPGNIKPYPLTLPHLQVYVFIRNIDSIAAHDAEKYAVRDRVEPGLAKVGGSDTRGEYVDEVTTETHTVRRGETVAKIARIYGVTETSIRQANNLGRRTKVKRGQKLRIVKTTRVYINENVPDTSTLPADNVAVPDTTAVSAPEQPETTPAPATTKATTSKPSRTEPETVRYTIRRGDTLSKIADQYGTTIDVICRDNQISNRNNVPVGTTLTITRGKTKTNSPQVKGNSSKKPSYTNYTVKNGDNLGKIAARHGVTVKAIKDANNLRNDNIRAGQTLRIPKKK